MIRGAPSDLLRQAGRLVVLSGSGISAESGVPTFRDDLTGLWARFRPEDLATPEAFRRDPRTVWAWYQERRRRVAGVRPNPGHRALAQLQRARPGSTLVTQNVDGLHQQAGSDGVLEFHGNLFRNRCRACGHVDVAVDLQSGLPPPCPHCDRPMGPDVVWFGEAIPADVLDAAWRAAAAATIFVAVGTSGMVHPAAGLAEVARWAGAFLVEVNIAETPLTGMMDCVLREPAGVALPRLVASILEPGLPQPGGS